MTLSSKPWRVVYDVKRPSRSRFKPPPFVPIQIFPFRSSCSAVITSLDNPSFVVKLVNLPSLNLLKPPRVPIHKLPFESSRIEPMKSFASPCFVENLVNSPSLIRFRPFDVPTQTLLLRST